MSADNLDPFAFARQGEPQTSEAQPRASSPNEIALFREHGEALAAEYDAPLPEGDAGLVEALRRLQELRPRASAFRRHPIITWENEKEITDPLTDIEVELEEFIEETAPETLAGAIVKLRYLTKDEVGQVLLNGAEKPLKQILALLEREAQP